MGDIIVQKSLRSSAYIKMFIFSMLLTISFVSSADGKESDRLQFVDVLNFILKTRLKYNNVLSLTADRGMLSSLVRFQVCKSCLATERTKKESKKMKQVRISAYRPHADLYV